MRLGFGVAAGVLAAAGVAAMAWAQAGPQPAGGRVKAMFDRVDTNRDGYITKAEADTARAAARTRMEAAARERRDRAFARLDSDKNGSVSRAEFDAAPRMAMMDGPRGRQSMRRAERGGGITGAGAFTRLDTDRDGRVSLAEAEAAADRRYAMRDDRRGRGGRDALPPGHPPVPGAGAPQSDSDRPLGGGRN